MKLERRLMALESQHDYNPAQRQTVAFMRGIVADEATTEPQRELARNILKQRGIVRFCQRFDMLDILDYSTVDFRPLYEEARA